MATMQINDARRTSLIPLLAIAVVLFTLLFLAVSAPSRHAVDNHGRNVWAVTQRFKQVDPDDDDVWQSTCPDGRRYTFRTLDSDAYDVTIDDPITGENITRFTCTSANWIAKKLEWCE